MISITICSRNMAQFNRLEQNINETIGIPHEIIRIDNTANRYGICAAYNLGASRSKYDLLCFSHEDILFHTNKWGLKVAEILSDKTIGIIGNAGTVFKTKSPSGHWSCPEKYDFQRKYIYQHYEDHSSLNLRNPSNEILSQVVTLDGMWLCMRKEVWSEYKFDEKYFGDFHFYDMDICFQVSERYRICVTYDVLIEHFSSGSVNRDWITNSIKFSKKWKSKLPSSTIQLSEELQNIIEMEVNQGFIELMLKKKYNILLILNYFMLFVFRPPLISYKKIKNIIKVILLAAGLRGKE